jgi:hypothetical protein
LSHRALKMPSFMDNTLGQVVPIMNQGLFFSPISGDREFPICATRDGAASPPGSCSIRPGGEDQVAVLGKEVGQGLQKR